MAGRYTEARLYLTGAGVALLLAAWAALAVQDRDDRVRASLPEPVLTEVRQQGQDAGSQPVRRAVPQTRTRAS